MKINKIFSYFSLFPGCSVVGKLLTKFVGQKRNQRWQQMHYSAGNQEGQPIDHDDNDDDNHHDDLANDPGNQERKRNSGYQEPPKFCPGIDETNLIKPNQIILQMPK